MNTHLLFPLAAFAFAIAFPAVAEEKSAGTAPTEKPAEKKADAPNKEGADGAWEEVVKAMRGDGQRPKSQEEANEMMTKRIKEMDEKGDAFLKAYPNDPRRWKVQLNSLMSQRARPRLGLKAMSDDEQKKLRQEILSAPDADDEVKATVSYFQVIEEEDDAKFAELADKHKKAYPKFRGNASLDARLKSMESQKELKDKPLDLSFTAVDGTEVDLAKMRGKVVLVDFWATWCGPCMQEVPNVVKAYKELHPKGFEIVGISLDNKDGKEKLLSTTKEKGMTWVQYFDGEGWKNKISSKFGINSIPAMWLINKKGMVVDFNARENLASKVEKLLAE